MPTHEGQCVYLEVREAVAHTTVREAEVREVAVAHTVRGAEVREAAVAHTTVWAACYDDEKLWFEIILVGIFT
jgi:hypothetical protein